MAKTQMDRRNFLRLGAASGALVVAHTRPHMLTEAAGQEQFGADRWKRAVGDRHSLTRRDLKAVPSSCLQCVAICGIIGYVGDGRLVKIEGNPRSPNNRGMICARGQSGVNQVYDPDRVLYPLKRVGARGEGKWKRISWDEALDEIAAKIKDCLDRGHPEEFMLHCGRNRCKWIQEPFCNALDTHTVGDHTSICEAGKWTAQELTWGKHYDINDVANTNYLLNFGCNVLEAHTSHSYFSQRVIEALARGVKLVTFDVRLSNTAAKSSEWVPIKPGTDLAVILAMGHVIIQRDDLIDHDFLETWTTTTVAELKEHLAQYTPEWAERISGVPAADLRRIALEFATHKPSTVLSYRGLVAHENGAMGERAAKMLDALVGNIDVPGGTCLNVTGKWGTPPDFTIPGSHKKLNILDGEGLAYPTHHCSHKVFEQIRKGAGGRPKVYMLYVHNPLYVNGDCQANIDTMKDESLLPYIVALDIALSESAQLADLVLPDATYLERYDPEAPQSYQLIPFVQIRQPVVKPLGEARAAQDVWMELARRLGKGDLFPFKTSEEYLRLACANTDGLKEAGGFDLLAKEGIFVQSDQPKYRKYAKDLGALAEFLTANAGAVHDEATGVVWNPAKNAANKTGKYGDHKDDYKSYLGQVRNGRVHAGFVPDKVPKSGLFELKSHLLERKGLPALPSWQPIPEHQSMGPDDLHLTSFKVNVHTQSRTQNCKWLTEMFHDNPAWLNPATAAKYGIKDGDEVVLTSKSDGTKGRTLKTKVHLTEGVHPQVIAISHHLGHWAYGCYASGKEAFPEVEGEPPWWKTFGVRPNWLIPNKPDPISGQWSQNDTVVSLQRA